MRDVHAGEQVAPVHPRYAMSWLKGPMTREERARLRVEAGAVAAEPRGAEPRADRPPVLKVVGGD